MFWRGDVRTVHGRQESQVTGILDEMSPVCSSYAPARSFRDLGRLVISSGFPSQTFIMKKTVVGPRLAAT